MCGRFVLTATPEELQALFGYLDGECFPAALQHRADPADRDRAHRGHGARRFALVRWGLVPSWVRTRRRSPPHQRPRRRPIIDNGAFKARHALPPLPGAGLGLLRMAEDAGSNSGQDAPAVLAPAARRRGDRPRRPVGDLARPPTAARSIRAASSPPRANDTVAPIHDRMPVVIAPEDFDHWLTRRSGRGDALLQPGAGRPARGDPDHRPGQLGRQRRSRPARAGSTPRLL